MRINKAQVKQSLPHLDHRGIHEQSPPFCPTDVSSVWGSSRSLYSHSRRHAHFTAAPGQRASMPTILTLAPVCQRVPANLQTLSFLKLPPAPGIAGNVAQTQIENVPNTSWALEGGVTAWEGVIPSINITDNKSCLCHKIRHAWLGTDTLIAETVDIYFLCCAGHYAETFHFIVTGFSQDSYKYNNYSCFTDEEMKTFNLTQS